MLTCDHCLISFPDHQAVRAEAAGKERVFCCEGCLGVYRLIHDEGLEAFYARRRWDEPGISEDALRGKDDVQFFAERVVDVDGMAEIDLYIDGIRCASCVWLNERILSRTEGVLSARVNYSNHRARVQWDPARVGLERILQRIRRVGYVPKPYSESEGLRVRRAESRDLLIRFGTAAFLSSQLMLYSIALYAGYFRGIDEGTKRTLQVIALCLTIPVVFYAGMPIIRGTLRGFKHGRFNMDSLIAIGSSSAFLYSLYGMLMGAEVYFDTAAMIVTLVLLGRFLESVARGRASETIEKLHGLTPREATRVCREAGSPRERVPVSSLRPGDLVEVKPGERIPSDGCVVEGRSEIDESLLTGESKPVGKIPGAEVTGGSTNLYGSLVFEVTRTGKDTVLSGIIRAVEDAQSARLRIQSVADRVVGVFVPAILILGLLTLLFHLMKGGPPSVALMTAISVIVIACPCSLGLAAPLAVMVFTSVGSSRGILIRSGDVIENVGKCTHVIFDKTGTITSGMPSVRDIATIDHDIGEDDLMSLAASIERLSEHSIGRAITEYVRSRDIPLVHAAVSGFQAVPGKGVRGAIDGREVFIGNLEFMRENCLVGGARGISPLADDILRHEREGDTVIYIGWGRQVRALVAVSDTLRHEASKAVGEIEAMGISALLVSGDNEPTTSSVASRVGIARAFSGVSPTGKREVVRMLQERGEKVVMVGDGINDAPALTEALVGVAMGKGTDIAMESADAVLMRNDLTLIPFLIDLSRRSFGIIKQNIFWALFYNVVAIPLAVAGVLHPIVAAGAMASSSLFVVGNSLRIRRGR